MPAKACHDFIMILLCFGNTSFYSLYKHDFKKSWNRHETNLMNKNKADEVSGTFDEKRWFGESGIDRKDRREEEQRKKMVTLNGKLK